MATVSPAVTESSAHVQWMWNENEDSASESKPSEWKPFSDVENMIIEEAFQDGQKHVVLDDYSIHFKDQLQVFDTDGNKQRLVKRTVCNRDDNFARKERFTLAPINPERPFAGQYGWISPFIRKAAKYLNITRENLPSKNAGVIPMIVEKAVVGIIEEGKKIGKQHEAEYLAKILEEKKHAEMRDVWKCCANLYSLESFLCKKVNEIMEVIGDENYGKDWQDQARTLGPFCLLLWDNPSNGQTTERGTILYRAAQFSDESISIFEEDCSEIDKPMHSFPSFISCSRNRAKVEPFGNVLFIMKVKHAFSVDLRPHSRYPDEEEELISPGVCFTVDRIKHDQNNNKYEIYLDLVQQYDWFDRSELSDDDDDDDDNDDNRRVFAFITARAVDADLRDDYDADEDRERARYRDACGLDDDYDDDYRRYLRLMAYDAHCGEFFSPAYAAVARDAYDHARADFAHRVANLRAAARRDGRDLDW